ncbi:MFS transporter [Cryptosporangium minutisporangium]|uniref:MFS transporter n=1 Tax=Cryptosporangium minutisporangium TaxID=113569 RepID=A0ABP6T1W4_9ACTN
MAVRDQFRSFDTTVRLLLVNQLSINLGFYMLMPYLAQHLAGPVGLATWAVGLVLGMRNFSQQGMFLVGGALADRFGYKPLIVAGCLLRTIGFGALGFAESLAALLIASAITGFAGALFNPAVRAYLAARSGPRRVEAFALFNIFYQAGILLGPVVGFLLLWSSFRAVCLVAAAIFAVLTVLQLRALPAQAAAGQQTDREAGSQGDPSTARGAWRAVLLNRRFLRFALIMTASYVLSFQIYLALPLELRRITGEGTATTVGVVAIFAVSGLLTLIGQTRVTAWCRRRRTPVGAMALGLVCLAAAFLPLLAATAFDLPRSGAGRALLGIGPALVAAAVLALGTMLAFPFEMDAIARLARDRRVATHYGLYNTICGIGITVGNLATGAVLDAARNAGLAALPWLALTGLGLLAAVALRRTEGRMTDAGRTAVRV